MTPSGRMPRKYQAGDTKHPTYRVQYRDGTRAHLTGSQVVQATVNRHITGHEQQRDGNHILYEHDGSRLQHWTRLPRAEANKWPQKLPGPYRAEVEPSYVPLVRDDKVLLRKDTEPLGDWELRPFHSPFLRLRPLTVTHIAAGETLHTFRLTQAGTQAIPAQLLLPSTYGDLWVLLKRKPGAPPLTQLNIFRPLKRNRSATPQATTTLGKRDRPLTRTRSAPARPRLQSPAAAQQPPDHG